MMETENEEILRFANWWISGFYRSNWKDKHIEFFDAINDFPIDIKIVIVDLQKCGKIELLENIPYQPLGHYVCCIYKGDQNASIK